MSKNRLITFNKLRRVPLSDAPLSPENPEPSRHLNTEEYKSIFHSEYNEGLYSEEYDNLNEHLRHQELFDLYIPASNVRFNGVTLERLIDQRSKNPLNHLVVCNLGEEVGYGLFTTQPIPKKTILFLYSGVIKTGLMALSPDNYYFEWLKESSLGATRISAWKTGGLARFLSHLPLDETTLAEYKEEPQGNLCDLSGIEFHREDIRENIATANTALVGVIFQGIPVQVVYTLRDVAAFEQLGYSYGSSYWKDRNKQPRLFFRDGTLVPLEDYTLRSLEPTELPSAAFFSQSSQDRLSEIESKSREGMKLMREKNYERAMEFYLKEIIMPLKAENGFEPVKKNSLLQLGYTMLVKCYQEMHWPELVIDAYEQSIDSCYLAGKKPNERTLNEYDTSLQEYFNLRQFPMSMLCEKAADLTDHYHTLNADEVRGKNSVFFRLKALVSLIEIFELENRLDRLMTGEEVRLCLANCYSTLASYYQKRGEDGDLQEARRRYEQAIAIRVNFPEQAAEIQKLHESLTEIDSLISSHSNSVEMKSSF